MVEEGPFAAHHGIADACVCRQIEEGQVVFYASLPEAVAFAQVRGEHGRVDAIDIHALEVVECESLLADLLHAGAEGECLDMVVGQSPPKHRLPD